MGHVIASYLSDENFKDEMIEKDWFR